jgi:predicted dehydrogenase
MLKFGAITIDTSHPKSFTKKLAEGERGRYVAVFNDGFRGEDEVNAFAEFNNLKVCSSVEELADMVDIGLVHSCNWDKHLSYVAPFIERDKPVFIDKPLVGNLKDARKLIELVNSGAKILGSSALRYCYEVQKVHATLQENNAKILHVNVSVGTNEFDYAIHAYEMICALLKDRPVDARHLGTAHAGDQNCDSYFFNFAGGTTAVINNVSPKYTGFHVTVLTDVRAADSCFNVDTSKLYEAMLIEVCNKLEGKENLLAPMEDQIIPIKAALACKASKLAGGKTVALDDPCLEDISYDGYAFEESYGSAAAKSYLNP